MRNESAGGEEGVGLAEWKYGYVKEPLILTGFILVIGILKIFYHMHKRISELIPESCCLILLGIVIGKLFSLDPENESHDFLVFHSRTFFLFILPPIILEASYSLRDAAFMGNISTILLFACLGTILNIVVVGLALVGLSHASAFPGLSVRWVDCFVFAALIASVDPVAVLAIFQEVGVNKVLYFLVLGESIFNDAVTIVIYNAMINFTGTGAITWQECLISVGAFFTESLGASMIGMTCGVITGIITRYTRAVQAVEPLFLFGMAYMSYLCAEMFSFSGIISIIVCGINQVHYAMRNISKESMTTVVYFAKAASSAMEALIFIILGVMIVNNTAFWGAWNTSFSLCSLVLVVAARFLVVFLLTYFANVCMDGLRHITFNEQVIMAYGGLRGAVSFSLAIMLSPAAVPVKDTLLTATFVVILFTVFIQGTTMKPLVKLLSIGLRHKKTVMIAEVSHAVLDDIMWGIEEVIDYEKNGKVTSAMCRIMSKCLIRKRGHECTKESHGKNFLFSLQKQKMEQEYDHSESESEPETDTGTESVDRPEIQASERTRLVPSEPNLHNALTNPVYRAVLSTFNDRDLAASAETGLNRRRSGLSEQDRRLRQLFHGHVPPWTPRAHHGRRHRSHHPRAPRNTLTVPSFEAAATTSLDEGASPATQLFPRAYYSALELGDGKPDGEDSVFFEGGEPKENESEDKPDPKKNP